MPKKHSVVLSLVLLAAIPYAIAQRVNWDMKNAQVLSQPLSSLPAQDRAGILQRLGGEPEDLLALKVKTASEHIFLVQGIFGRGSCGMNNCGFLILSSHYKVLLSKVTQMYKLQPSTHHGLPDVITSMHGSAFDSRLSYWRFQGRRYVRVACADAVYGDADGNFFKNPHISLYLCGSGG